MIESIHRIYDSYIDLCLKEPGYLRRYDPSDAIELVGMSEQSEIPKQLQKFWSSIPNKENIQLLSRKRNDYQVFPVPWLSMGNFFQHYVMEMKYLSSTAGLRKVRCTVSHILIGQLDIRMLKRSFYWPMTPMSLL